eukprot:gene20933-27133_t
MIYIVNGAILRRGNPLTWSKAKPFLSSVRTSGVKQFIAHYNRVKDVQTPKFFWGDELEYGIFSYNESINTYDLSINRGAQLLDELSKLESNLADLPYGCIWQPEYGSWMIETVPREPFNGYISSLLLTEKSMQLRRKRLHSHLLSNEIAPSITAFPLLGVKGLSHSAIEGISNNISESIYVSDNVINPHPRFGALTQNIRMRRGRKVDINIPTESNSADSINMDAMAFGMGSCCLQITMQCSSENESRYLHDQLAIFAPIFLALSAATPMLRGKLAGTDTRWDAISQSVDDRTVAELGEHDANYLPDCEMVGGGIKRIHKSRYSSVSSYLNKPSSKDEEIAIRRLNDIDAGIDSSAFELLRSNPNIDETLASYIAHLFIRDPLVIFEDSIYLDDQAVLDHFENIQSTNWRTIRWKPPVLSVGIEAERRKRINDHKKIPFNVFNDQSDDNSASTDINSFGPGWRVEFRPLEIQLTDFENAAYTITIVLLARSLLAMGYNFYLPMSKLEENFRRSQLIDAVLNEKFYVNRLSYYSNRIGEIHCPDDSDVVEMSIDEIINGSEDKNHLGVIPAIKNYLNALGCNKKTLDQLYKYLSLISDRASGKLPTAARWMRNYVKSHEHHDINKDDVSFETIKDLLKLCNDIGLGRADASRLVGNANIEKLCKENAHETYLNTKIDKKFYFYRYYISVALVAVWIVFEPIRLYFAFSGNLAEKVPDLATYLLLTICPQLPLVGLMAYFQLVRYPIDGIMGSLMLVFLFVELYLGGSAMRKQIRMQTSQFMRNEERVARSEEDSLSETIGPISLSRISDSELKGFSLTR